MSNEAMHSMQALSRYDNTVMHAALLRYYFKKYFHSTPLNYHYQEATCYNAKTSFAIQCIGRYHAVEHYWQWGYALNEHDSAFYAVVNSMREHTLVWNDVCFNQTMCFPADETMLSWLVNIAVSFAHTPLYVLRRTQDGNVFDILSVHDSTLADKLVRMYHVDPEPHEAIIQAWDLIKRDKALMYKPLDAINRMATAFSIPVEQTGNRVVLSTSSQSVVFTYDHPQPLADPVLMTTKALDAAHSN